MVSLVFGAHLFAAATTGAVAVLALRQRRAPGARWFSVLMGGVALWALVGAAQQHPLFYDPVVFSVLVRLIWVPSFVIGIAVLAFALTYTGREEHVTRRRVGALSVLPAIVTFVAFCHPILLDELAGALGPYGWLPMALQPVADIYPIADVVGAGYVYLLAVVASLLLLEVVVERPFPHPGQALMLLLVVPPWVLSVIQSGLLQWDSFNPAIAGFVLSGVAGFVAVSRFRLLDVPLARARVVDAVDSGVVVCNRDGSVHDYNEQAAGLLDLSNDVLGTDIRTVLAESPLEAGTPAPPQMNAASPAGESTGGVSSVGGTATETSTAGGAVGTDTASTDGGRLDQRQSPFETTQLDGQTVSVAGSERPSHVELQVSPLEDVAGDPMSHVLLLYDVSDRERRKRELERKNEFLDEFASVVSHDVATPLSVIENKARLVEVTGDPDHASDIYEATERVQTLVDELRDLAQEGVRVGETSPVALSAAAQEAWQSVDSGDATLTVASSSTLIADRSRLRQLLENLLHNAVEHGSTSSQTEFDDAAEHSSTSSQTEFDDAAEHRTDGGPVTVEVGSLPEGGFYVADDGPGIPPDVRRRVFEQGYTTAEDSRGLGLAIVDRIVQGHDWRIEITESTDGGARFEIYTER